VLGMCIYVIVGRSFVQHEPFEPSPIRRKDLRELQSCWDSIHLASISLFHKLPVVTQSIITSRNKLLF